MKKTYDEILEENIRLQALVEKLQALIEKLQAQIKKLTEHNEELEVRIKKLVERNEELEARINQNSKNSSKPPSSDQKPNLSSLDTSDSPKKAPYHTGVSRTLLPESSVTSREIRSIGVCPRCRSQMQQTGEVHKWQQIELPKIKPLVHQIELYTSVCSNCHLVTRPKLSENEQLLLGPRLEALINLCLGQFRQSHRAVREFMATIIPDLQLSQGLISKIKARASYSLETAHQQITQTILDRKAALHIDATGWRHNGKNEQAVILRSGNWISFFLLKNQNGKTLAEIIQGKEIYLVSDRGLPASQLHIRMHQYCLAHLLRNIQGVAEHPSTTLRETAQLGEVYNGIQELFIDKHRADCGKISISTLRQYGYAIKRFLKEIIEDILLNNPSKKVWRFCRKILKDWDYFFTYLKHPEGPMTNNLAEEALRSLVIVRKLCFGSRSSYGRKWRANIQSCIETLRRHGYSILDFLVETIQATRTKRPLPLLSSAY